MDLRLGRRSFGEACNALVGAVDPFAQFSQNVNTLKTLENVALAAAFVAFSVAIVSCHSG